MAEEIRLVVNWEKVPLAPSSVWIHFWSWGCPTSPVVAEARECPMRGTVPRKRGL